MTAVMSSLESLLDLDAEHWPLDPKPGAHAYLDEESRRSQPVPSTSDHTDDFADFLAHAGFAAVTPQGSHCSQQPQQQTSPAELALELAVKPARPSRQRVRSKEVNRRNQRSYREKKKVRCDVGATLLCILHVGSSEVLLRLRSSLCVLQTELQRLQAELDEMRQAIQHIQSDKQHLMLTLAQKANAQAWGLTQVPHLPWQVRLHCPLIAFFCFVVLMAHSDSEHCPSGA